MPEIPEKFMDLTNKLLVILIIIVGFVFLAIIAISGLNKEENNRKECTTSGGHILEVQDGRGGYVCVPKECGPDK